MYNCDIKHAKSIVYTCTETWDYIYILYTRGLTFRLPAYFSAGGKRCAPLSNRLWLKIKMARLRIIWIHLYILLIYFSFYFIFTFYNCVYIVLNWYWYFVTVPYNLLKDIKFNFTVKYVCSIYVPICYIF